MLVSGERRGSELLEAGGVKSTEPASGGEGGKMDHPSLIYVSDMRQL